MVLMQEKPFPTTKNLLGTAKKLQHQGKKTVHDIREEDPYQTKAKKEAKAGYSPPCYGDIPANHRQDDRRASRYAVALDEKARSRAVLGRTGVEVHAEDEVAVFAGGIQDDY